MLTPEDTLRLNVLISTCVAIRVDVYKLVVVGLTADKKEQTITLNPDIDSSKYIQAVQKLLVNKVLASNRVVRLFQRWFVLSCLL